MREKIRFEEDNYLRKQKVAQEVTKLSEELRAEQKAWNEHKAAKTKALESWWNKMVEEEDVHKQEVSIKELEENEKKIDAIYSLADGNNIVYY